MHYQMPSPFEVEQVPYAVAQVDLDEGLRVSGMLTTVDPEALPVGARVDLVIERIRADDQGTAVSTWKFAPAGQGGAR